MGKFVIFCAAEFDGLAEPLGAGDFVLAADGGLRHTQALGIAPDEILGDFDSLGYTPEGSRVFPVEKDDTDAMLAARRGLALGYRDFRFYGGVDGERLDHTVANIQTLHFLCAHGARGMLIGRNWVYAVIRDGEITFPAAFRGTISVFCLGADAQGVTLEGLYYPLERGTLTAAFPLGVSNHFTGQSARVSVERGTLLIMWERANGLPREE